MLHCRRSVLSQSRITNFLYLLTPEKTQLAMYQSPEESCQFDPLKKSSWLQRRMGEKTESAASLTLARREFTLGD
jgi:hypothetical protein